MTANTALCLKDVRIPDLQALSATSHLWTVTIAVIHFHIGARFECCVFILFPKIIVV